MDEVDEPQPQPDPEPELELLPQPESLLEHLAAPAAEPVEAVWEAEPDAYSELEAEPGPDLFSGGEADAADDQEADEEEKKERRVPLGTKVALVAAAWVLLTVFLVGVFNKDGKDDTVRLSQAPGAAASGDGGGGDGGDGEDGGGSSEGDGVEEGDADATVESYAVERGTGGTATGAGAMGPTTADGTPSGGESSPGGSTATTARSGGGGGGGSSSTTPPAGGGGGGGGGSSSTTAPTGGGGGGGGGGSTTTQPATTTTAPAATVTIKRTESSDFSTNAVTIPRGKAVRFKNDDAVPRTLVIDDNTATTTLVPAGESRSIVFPNPGKFRVKCSDPGKRGHLDVTVT